MNEPLRPATGNSAWSQKPERSNMFWLKVMTWISLQMGRTVSRAVLYAIAAYFLVFAPSARQTSASYLKRALKLPPGLRVGWSHMFRHFLSFASAVHDRVYLVNDRFDLFDVRVHNQQLIDSVVAEGKGVFLIGAHLGSFEVLRAVGRKQPGLRIAMVMFEENARKINAALNAINPNARMDIIPLGHIDSMMRVHDMLAQGTVVGMLGDRSIGMDETFTVNFMDDQAGLPMGAFRMAAVLKRPVLFMTGLYRGGNRYDVHFDTIADFSSLPPRGRTQAVHAAMTRYAALMEEHCYSAPYNWFNFFDFWQPTGNLASRRTPDTA